MQQAGTVSSKTVKILMTLEPSAEPVTGPAATLMTEDLPAAEPEAMAVPPVRSKKKQREQEYDVCIKLLLLGDAGVGKTSLMMRFAEQEFSTSLLSTAGCVF